MTARNDTYALMEQAHRWQGISLSFDEANTLRRAQITLHRWGEEECGNSGPFFSWAIERDEETNLPYRCVYPHTGKSYRTRIADKEAGALRRIKTIAERVGFSFYHQTDPRGCALYISREPLTLENYTRGMAFTV